MKNFLAKAAALGLSAAMMVASAVPAFAAQTDLVDTSQKGSLTITKYDQSAYESVTGNSVSSLNLADGEQDSEVSAAMDGYELEGVQFGVFRAGSMYSYVSGGKIVICYSLPSSLQNLLGLSDSDAIMTQTDGKCFTSDQINEAMSALLTYDTDGKNKLESWWASAGITSYYKETNSDGIAKFEDLTLGLYLVVETDVPENIYSTTDPFFVSLPMTDSTGSYWLYDVYVYPKNQSNNPTIDKVVKDPDKTDSAYTDYVSASEGDILYYRIVLGLPTITSESTYLTQFSTVDTQADGIYYNDDFVILWYDNEADAKTDDGGKNAVATWANGSDYFTVTYQSSPAAVNGTAVNVGSVRIDLTASGLAEVNKTMTETASDNTKYTSLYTQYSGKYMVIVYTSTVYSSSAVELGDANKSAAVDSNGVYIANGNENNAELTYSRSGGGASHNSTWQTNSIQDTSKVFVYGISGVFTDGETVEDADPVKTFKTSTGTPASEDASAVTFILYNSTMGYYVPATTTDSKTGSSTAGVYYVTDDLAAYHVAMADAANGQVDSSLSSILSAIELHPDSTGHMRIEGLEAGTYILTEIKTVNGYSLLKDPITIVIDGTDVSMTPEKAGITGVNGGANTEPTYVQTDAADAVVDGTAVTMGDGSKDSDNGFVMIAIENTGDFNLPPTGGLGTILFTLAGVAVVIIGVLLVTRDKDKKNMTA